MGIHGLYISGLVMFLIRDQEGSFDCLQELKPTLDFFSKFHQTAGLRRQVSSPEFERKVLSGTGAE